VLHRWGSLIALLPITIIVFSGIVLAMLVITGIHLFLLPYLVRRKRVR
jgi:hypothetical protein